MPIRKINFTERVRVNRDDAVVTIGMDEDKGNSWFDASIDLSRYRLPENALVFVEAYRKTQRLRLPFGTVGKLAVPAQNQRQLNSFVPSEGILFRVRVTDPGNGLILAEADRLHPRNEDEIAGNRSLLPVQPEDLGQECWRVSFAEKTGPVFEINKEFPNWREESKSRRFRALVYPAVLREILGRILLMESSSDMDDNDYWMTPWLRFAATTLRAGPPPDAGGESITEPWFIAEVDDWINRATVEFCRRTGAFDKISREGD